MDVEQGSFIGLPLTVRSEDRKLYIIEPFVATLESIDFLWEFVKKHPFLYSDTTREDFDAFQTYILSPAHVILLVTQVCEDYAEDEKDKTVGVLYGDKIRPEWDMFGHYLFWDTVQKGRQKVIFAGINWFMQQFDLHKIHMEVPIFAYSVLRRIRRMGFLFEGLNRQAILSNGKWKDKLRFGIMREEVTDEVLNRGYITRGPLRRDWYGLLGQDEILRHAIMKRD